MIVVGRAELKLWCVVATLVASFACFSLAVPASGFSPPGQKTTAGSAVTLQGKLIPDSPSGPVLRTEGKEYPLAARTTWLYHTLQDKRLADREVRLEGTLMSGGILKVNQLYTVRDGKLFRVRYVCDVCYTEALRPASACVASSPPNSGKFPWKPSSAGLEASRDSAAKSANGPPVRLTVLGVGCYKEERATK